MRNVDFSGRTKDLMKAFHGVRAKEKYIAMFNFYIDDSGTAPNQSVAIAAGWIAKAPSWYLFDRDWAKVQNTQSHKFSSMHMAEFVNGAKKSEFENWSLDTKRKVFKKLACLVRKRALKGFAIGVIKKDFDDIVPESLRVQGCENHYTYAVRRVMGMIHDWRKSQSLLDDQIEYFFDFMEPSDSRRKEIEKVFTTIGTAEENFRAYGLRKDGFNFKDRKTLPALQAADMLAWTIYRAMQQEVKEKNANLMAIEAFKDFCKSPVGFVEGGYNRREHLIEWVRSKGLNPLVSA